MLAAKIPTVEKIKAETIVPKSSHFKTCTPVKQMTVPARMNSINTTGLKSLFRWFVSSITFLWYETNSSTFVDPAMSWRISKWAAMLRQNRQKIVLTTPWGILRNFFKLKINENLFKKIDLHWLKSHKMLQIFEKHRRSHTSVTVKCRLKNQL